jgi:phospholipase/carboxylesterase
MHRNVRVLTVALAFAPLWLACEARAPEPAIVQPAAAPTPPPTPAPPVATPVVADELPLVGEIHYLEIVTGGADPESSLPMIIALHGLGDSPQGFRAVLEEFDRPARVILPRALDVHEEGWSWFPIRARDNDIEALARGIDHAADVLAPAIAELTQQRPTIGKPIVTGFSQGGMLSFALAVEHGELFAAALPIGGWLPDPLWPAAANPSAPPIVAFHGDADAAVRYEPTKLCVENLQGLGYRVELRTYVGVGHMISSVIHLDLMESLRQLLPATLTTAVPPARR